VSSFQVLSRPFLDLIQVFKPSVTFLGLMGLFDKFEIYPFLLTGCIIEGCYQLSMPKSETVFAKTLLKQFSLFIKTLVLFTQ
jgi:hypothetical protein